MHILAEFTPWDPIGATRPTVRASSGQDRLITALNGVKWWPAISVKPALSMKLFDGDFSSDLEPGDVSMTVQVDKLVKADANAGRYRWAGAKMTIYAGNAGDAWPWTIVFQGLVTRFEAEGNRLKLTGSVDTEPFETNALTANYAGTGGAEGGADLKNTPKPWLFGRCQNCEPVLIDSVNNVYQFSSYGPVQAVNALYERANDFGAAVGDYATYAALVAATIPAGRWGTSLATGLIRLGAPAYGVITGDVDGDKPSGTWLRKTGEIVQRIASNAGISGTLVDSTSWNALDAALVTLLPNDGRIGLYLTEQTSVIDIARRLARPCNAQAGVSWLGKLFAVRVAIGTPAATLDAQGRQRPYVTSSIEVDVSPPYWRIEMGSERSWRVHTYDEIATYAPLVDRGAYSSSATYREGNIVQDQTISWEYINPTASTGNAPPTLPTTSNSYWKAMDSKLGNIADGATKNTVTYASSAPSSPTNGDIWVDTSSTPYVLKARISGAWQTSSNYVTQGTDIGVANGATKNTVTYSSSAPGSPTNGDIWVDTTAVPYIVKMRISGAWQATATNVTQGTDIGLANNATSDLVLTSIGSTGMTVVGNTIVRSAGTNDFTACVRGEATLGSAYAEVVIPAAGYAMVALDTDATSFTQAAMDIIAYCYNGVDLQVYAAGVNIFNTAAPGSVAGQKLAVSYDGVRYRAYLNGVQKGADVAATAAQRVWPKWHSFTSGATITGLRAMPATTNIWTDISGTFNAPADNATVNRLTYSSSAPGSPVNGDIWVDTSLTPNVAKIRVSGAWQIASNYVTQGTDIGVANGATKNTVTRSSSAPGSPTDGDIWVDTSVTPNVVKTRISGAWQISANYVTQGSDIGVANGASVADSIVVDMFYAQGLTSYWYVPGSFAATALPSNLGQVTTGVKLPQGASQDSVGVSAFIRDIVPGSSLWCSCWVYITKPGGGATNPSLYASFDWYTAASGFISETYAFTPAISTLAGLSQWIYLEGYVTAPSNAAMVGFNFIVVGNHSDHIIYMTGLRIARVQGGSDVTAQAQVVPTPALDQTVYYDYTGTAKAGQLTRALTNYLKKGGVDVSSAATWAFTPSGCTVTAGSNGVVTLNTVSATDASIFVSATYGGKAYTWTILISKVQDNPPGGGSSATSFTGGVSGTVNQTSYSTPVVIATGTMLSNGSGQVRLNATVEYQVTAALTSGSVDVKWQRSLAGANTWSDAGVSATGTTSNGPSGALDDFGNTGAATTNSLATGMTASTAYDFRLLGKYNTTSLSVSGSVSGAQS